MNLEIDGLIVFAFIVLLSLQIISFFSKKRWNDSYYPKLTDDIGQWAFGDGWKFDNLQNLHHRWNKLHSDIFFVYGHEKMFKTFDKIIQAYKENYGSQT